MHRKMKIYISTVKKIWAEICWNIFSSLPFHWSPAAIVPGKLMYPYSGPSTKGTFGRRLIN
ncbi:hypothetical protein D3C74_472860 [compost metagenome]